MLWISRDREKHKNLVLTVAHGLPWWELCQPSVRPDPPTPPGAGLLNCSCIAGVEAGCHQPAWEMIFIDPRFLLPLVPSLSLSTCPVTPIICEWRRGMTGRSRKRECANRPFTFKVSVFSIISISRLLMACLLLPTAVIFIL